MTYFLLNLVHVTEFTLCLWQYFCPTRSYVEVNKGLVFPHCKVFGPMIWALLGLLIRERVSHSRLTWPFFTSCFFPLLFLSISNILQIYHQKLFKDELLHSAGEIPWSWRFYHLWNLTETKTIIVWTFPAALCDNINEHPCWKGAQFSHYYVTMQQLLA